MSDASTLEQRFERGLKAADSLEALEALRKEFVGGKGELDTLLKNLKNLPAEDRQKAGQALNILKTRILKAIDEKKGALERDSLEKSLASESPDPTLPSRAIAAGRAHPLTRVMNEIIQIFLGMGFGVAEGPEAETDENNFGSLNFLPDHPARDMHDTFFIKGANDDLLLRTHTSPVQIREMKKEKPPLRFIAPGKVFRHEAVDATHSSVFHQVEGLVVDKDISFGDLKGTLEMFVKRFFGEDVRTRFNPSYFPFVEPGAQMDISCTVCDRAGRKNGGACPVCKGSGWLEMLGAGMVHPNVFKAVGYNPEEVGGFAFGMGIERIAMIRYGVADMRLFYQNHLDFLEQF